jgi:hypothetical protein
MDEITLDTATLRAAVDKSRDKMGRARVKPKLRARLVAYVKERAKAGDARDQIGRELGLSIGTIHAWLSPGGDRRRSAKRPKPKLQRVEVVDPSTVTVHARHGVRVELTLAQVAELLRAL